VEEAWRSVDPVLAEGTPVHDYAPAIWRPSQVIEPEGGWDDPIVGT
jgi:hypothetical protein